MSKNIELKEETKKSLGSDIIDGWTADNNDRADWLRDLAKWLDAYQGRIKPKNIPWEGASNLHVPVTATVIEAIHPRLMAALFKPTPIVSFRPQEPTDLEMSERWEQFLDYAVREEVGIFPIMDRCLLGMLINGIQVIKTTWEVDTRNIRDKHMFDLQTDPMQAIEAVLAKEEAYADAINRLTEEEYEVVLKDRKVKLEVEETKKGLCVYTEREEVIRDAPSCTLIRPEDIAFNSNCPYDIQKADHIYHRYWLDLDQIKRNVKKGVFSASKEELEDIERLQSADISPDDNTMDVKVQQEDVTGTKDVYREGDPEHVELIDAYMRYDIDDDGYDEEVIVTIVKDSPKIVLRVNRLESVYRHGMRPFTLFYMNPVSDSVWAIGMPQVVESLQQEFNVIHNQRVDAGQISNTPWGFYQPAAGFKNEKVLVEPGFMLPVNDVSQVKMHQPANFTSNGFQEENQLLMYLEKRTKVNDLTIGRVGDVQGAARTATGVQALSAQQASGFDIYIRRVQESFKQLLQQLLALYKEYMPDGKQYRIVGKLGEPEYVVSREDLTGRMDMIFTGNSLSTDREIERNTTTFLAQSVMAPQSQQFLLQLGIMNPQGIAEWYRHLMKVFDVPRFERILTTPPSQEILQPTDIVTKLLAGEKLLPKQGENHQEVIMLIQQKVLAPEMAGQLPPEIMVLMQQQLELRNTALQQDMMRQAIQQAVQQMMMAQQMPYIPGVGGAPIGLPQGSRGLPY